MQSARRKFILFIACFSVSIACGVYYTNPFMAIWTGPLFAAVVYLTALALLKIMEHLVRNRKVLGRLSTCLAAVAVAFLPLMHSLIYSPSPRHTYKVLLEAQPPSSATGFESSWDHPTIDGIWRLRFTIDSAQLPYVLRRFVQVPRDSILWDTTDMPTHSPYIGFKESYLRYCDSVSWWDIAVLKDLPKFEWNDDRFWRTLWLDRNGNNGRFIVYISAV